MIVMNSKTHYIAFLTLWSVLSPVLADSPLTSTNFSKAYKNEPVVIQAAKAKGQIDNSLMEYITAPNNPIELKMAVINELGWKVEGQNNSVTFLRFLNENKGFRDINEVIANGRNDELLCYSYLKAMDDYFHVTYAVRLAEQALAKKPDSFTYNIIAAIIKAQSVSMGHWRKIYLLADEVRKNKHLNQDMKDDAVKIIFDYMVIYKDSKN